MCEEFEQLFELLRHSLHRGEPSKLPTTNFSQACAEEKQDEKKKEDEEEEEEEEFVSSSSFCFPEPCQVFLLFRFARCLLSLLFFFSSFLLLAEEEQEKQHCIS